MNNQITTNTNSTNKNSESLINKIGDKIGICASGLCLIHCLATPFLLLLFPATSIEVFDTHIFHEVFALVVVASIIFAVYPHCRKHGHKDIIVLAVVGTVLIVLSVLIETLPEFFHISLTISGSLFMIAAHLKNMKVRHGKCESDSKCSSKDH